MPDVQLSNVISMTVEEIEPCASISGGHTVVEMILSCNQLCYIGLNDIKIMSVQVSTCPGCDFNTVASVVSAVPEIKGMCLYEARKECK